MKKGLAALLFASQMLLSFSPGAGASAEGAGETYYPAGAWRTSTPEEQGMDSQTLLSMFEKIQSEKVPVHSVLILRHGYLVCEAYFQPFHREIPHNLFSTTKSFTSTLIGIAIAEGKLKGVDQRIADIFPDVKMPENDLGTKDMTLENILTMTAGHQADSVDAVFGSRDWVQTFFSLPFSFKPGTRFLYDSGASHLLSAVLKKTTGESEEAYARKRLFEPLGIKDHAWEKSTEGLNTGGWGLRLTPTDMAKFGYMILHKGVWNGKQIVPAQWVEAATQKHTDSYWGENRGDDYGYQFWMNSFGGFRADGFAGQYVCILPEKDLVAVFTSGINYSEPYQPLKLMGEYVVPAVQADVALPENPVACEKLAAHLRALENPAPIPVPNLPGTAQRISGKTFKTTSFFSSYCLTFDKAESCTLRVVQQGKTISLPVGLDGVYRTTNATRLGTLAYYPPYPGVALKGRWEGENTFIIDWQYVGEPYHEEYKVTFEDAGTAMEVTEYVVGCAGPMNTNVRYVATMKD